MKSRLTLPELDPRATWSIRVVDDTTGVPLLEHDPDVQLETASVGKIFLLIEVARRLENGELDPTERVQAPAEFEVADSGILHRMQDRHMRIDDLALLVGAFSDNLATNALLHRCGLSSVQAVAPGLGYAHSSLHDYIRDTRTPNTPWTPSYGTARELADVMHRLARGTVVSPGVSKQVLDWLASNADTSLVADAFQLDPFAHVEPGSQGLALRHKTGSTSFANLDVGHVSGSTGAVVYAVGANWKHAESDPRAAVTFAMRAIGKQIRAWVTGFPGA